MPIMVASLELKVCDDREPLYFRAFAWTRLLKVWTSSRADDLQGILPDKMEFGSRGLHGVFDRAKTSGAGRRTRRLPFFVSRHAFLVEPRWLEVGFRLWQGPGFNFSRDYLLPLPDQDMNACALRMALYGDMATMAKSLHSTLTRPQLRNDKWEPTDELIFPEAVEVSHFREHSERNFMATLATWAGVDRDRRMYLGRWCVVETADEHVRSASYVVHALQVHVVRQLCADPQLLEVGMDEFEAATRASHGGILQGSERLRLPAYWGLWRLARLPAPPTRGLPEVPQPVEEPGPEEGAKFFVSVLGKRGLCVKGCGLVPGALARVEYLQTTEGAQYDWACRRCFPPKASGAKTEGSSEENSSSSTVHSAE